MAEVMIEDARQLEAILEATAAGAAAFLRTLAERPAAAVAPEAPALPGLPDEGWGAARAIELFRARLEPLLSGSAGPRYLGFVTGGTTPAALAGDWLTAAYDQNVIIGGDSIAAGVERHALAMLRALFGLPDAFDGVFVTGATQANLVALATARQWAYEQVGIDIADAGLAGAPPLAVLAGAPHASIDKALAILGMGRRSIERVACIAGRPVVDAAALDAALRARRGGPPCIVVASAGEVNTGDFDDLRAVAAAARAHGAWLHVDGAFGLFAAADPARAHLVDGIEDADSIAADAHKWLNVPYDSGFVLTRHLAAQTRVFRASAAYLDAATADPLHRGPENSRRFRALPAWMTLIAYGRDGYRALVQRCCAHAAQLAAHLRASPRFELLADAPLNIVCFALRTVDPAARDRFLDALHRDGRTFLTPTTYGGRPAIRAAFSNWSTTAADVGVIIDALESASE